MYCVSTRTADVLCLKDYMLANSRMINSTQVRRPASMCVWQTRMNGLKPFWYNFIGKSISERKSSQLSLNVLFIFKSWLFWQKETLNHFLSFIDYFFSNPIIPVIYKMQVLAWSTYWVEIPPGFPELCTIFYQCGYAHCRHYCLSTNVCRRAENISTLIHLGDVCKAIATRLNSTIES